MIKTVQTIKFWMALSAVLFVSTSVLATQYYYEHYRKQRLIQRLKYAETANEQNEIFRTIWSNVEDAWVWPDHYAVELYDKNGCSLPYGKNFSFEQAEYVEVTWDSYHTTGKIKLKDKDILSLLMGE